MLLIGGVMGGALSGYFSRKELRAAQAEVERLKRTGEFTSKAGRCYVYENDGKWSHAWNARADGMCYMADKPTGDATATTRAIDLTSVYPPQTPEAELRQRLDVCNAEFLSLARKLRDRAKPQPKRIATGSWTVTSPFKPVPLPLELQPKRAALPPSKPSPKRDEIPAGYCEAPKYNSQFINTPSGYTRVFFRDPASSEYKEYMPCGWIRDAGFDPRPKQVALPKYREPIVLNSGCGAVTSDNITDLSSVVTLPLEPQTGPMMLQNSRGVWHPWRMIEVPKK